MFNRLQTIFRWDYKRLSTGFLTVLRMLVGWHFLYEGLAKWFAPHWSAAGYLLSSHWLLSGLFHRLAADGQTIAMVNQLNIYGLMVIGLCLLTGFMTRLSALAGAGLLLLYYVANPPFVGFIGQATGEGHYLVVNKNVLEFVLLVLFVVLPRSLLFGIDRLWSRTKAALDEPLPSAPDRSKRETIKDLLSLPLLGAFSYAIHRKARWESFEERHLVSDPSRTDAVTGASPRGAAMASLQDLTAKVPCGKIGDVTVSRLICGGNLISGYAHSRDLLYVSPLVVNYFTDEKVMETLSLCEACGINTAFVRVDNNTLRILRVYRYRGGKIQWFAQCKITDEDIRSDIDAAVDNGAVGAYIHGGVCDDLVHQGKLELLTQALEYIKRRGILAGLGAHKLQVLVAAEQAGLNPDFYMKTLNSGNYWTAGPKLPKPENWIPDPRRIVEPELIDPDQDNIWSLTPRQTIEFMKSIKKPWIAYKVLGAGAIKPEEGLRYAFENGADFTCVGMFDFQVVPDANITVQLLKKPLPRHRAWMA